MDLPSFCQYYDHLFWKGAHHTERKNLDRSLLRKKEKKKARNFEILKLSFCYVIIPNNKIILDLKLGLICLLLISIIAFCSKVDRKHQK